MKCNKCDKKGMIEYEDGSHIHKISCDKCNGTGYL